MLPLCFMLALMRYIYSLDIHNSCMHMHVGTHFTSFAQQKFFYSICFFSYIYHLEGITLPFFFSQFWWEKIPCLPKKKKKCWFKCNKILFFLFFFLTKRKNHVILLVVPFLKSSWTNKAVSVFLTHGCGCWCGLKPAKEDCFS